MRHRRRSQHEDADDALEYLDHLRHAWSGGSRFHRRLVGAVRAVTEAAGGKPPLTVVINNALKGKRRRLKLIDRGPAVKSRTDVLLPSRPKRKR